MEKYDLYDGDVELRYTDGNHRYDVKVDGEVKEWVPSATGVTGIKDKSDPLMYWYGNLVEETIKESLKPGMRLDEMQISRLAEYVKNSRWRTSKEATDIGKHVHDTIEEYVKKVIEHGDCEVCDPGEQSENPHISLPYNDKARNSLEQFFEWEANHEIEWIASERKVYSRDWNVAGTLDAEAIVDGEYTLIDFKTSNGIYASHYLQGAFYIKAREEEDPDVDFEGIIILRVPKYGREFEVGDMTDRDVIDEHIEAFEGALELYNWAKKYD